MTGLPGIGAELRRGMDAKGLDLEALARESGLSETRTALALAGSGRTTTHDLVRLALTLGVTLEFGFKKKPTVHQDRKGRYRSYSRAGSSNRRANSVASCKLGRTSMSYSQAVPPHPYFMSCSSGSRSARFIRSASGGSAGKHYAVSVSGSSRGGP
jgi:transcriptional regulator with XRE-family HTH domain